MTPAPAITEPVCGSSRDTSQPLTKKPSFSRLSRSVRALPSTAIIRRVFWPRGWRRPCSGRGSCGNPSVITPSWTSTRPWPRTRRRPDRWCLRHTGADQHHARRQSVDEAARHAHRGMMGAVERRGIRQHLEASLQNLADWRVRLGQLASRPSAASASAADRKRAARRHRRARNRRTRFCALA